MSELVMYLVPALGIVGLLVMAVKSAWVSKQEAGDATMTELAGHIAKGAMAFLKAEWRVMAIYAVIAAGLLAWAGSAEAANSHWVISIAFLIGAVFSALAGYFGMNIATKANVRTTYAAKTSLSQALKVSFTGGTVMGLGVAGLAVLGLGGLFIVLYQWFVAGSGANSHEMEKALEIRNFTRKDKPKCLEIFKSNHPKYFATHELPLFDKWLDTCELKEYFVWPTKKATN